MQPLISVIVPVYNLEAYIARTLDSILLQRYKNLEIIVVDDGSGDSSWDVITQKAAQDARIRPVRQNNAGVTAARLKGISEATGEWIGFVDGDDTIHADMYKILLENAVAHDADISHCGYQMEFCDGRVNLFHGTQQLRLQDQTAGVCDLLDGGLVEPGLCNKLYRRELFAGLSEKMPRDIKINEDLLMNYYLFSKAQKSVFHDVCLYHYIVRQTSASRSKLNEHRIYDPIRVREYILQVISAELKPLAQRALMNTCVYSYCSLVLEKAYPTAEAKKQIRSKLLAHKDWCAMLPRKTKLLADLIIYAPGVMKTVYPVYAKYLQKSKYD